MDKSSVVLVEGGLSIDDRGSVAFTNSFHFEDVRRYYIISNHQAGFVRAWHAHEHEGKYVTVVSGAALVGTVQVDNFTSPSRDLKPERRVLSEHNPQVLWIPPGFANGFMSLSENTRVLFFSTSTLEQSRSDDYRYDSRYWDIWEVKER